MLPKTHIFLGLIFSLLLKAIFPLTNWFYIFIIFLFSFLIDFDHYVAAVKTTKKWSLKKALNYYEKLGIEEEKRYARGIRKKGHFYLFHTLEFHALVGIIGIWFAPFMYIFIGMVFHSLLDFIFMIIEDKVYHREYFLFNWLKMRL